MPPYTRTRKRALAELEPEEIEVTWTGRKRGKGISIPEPSSSHDIGTKIGSLEDVSEIFKNVIRSDLMVLETSLKVKQNKILQLEEKLIKRHVVRKCEWRKVEKLFCGWGDGSPWRQMTMVAESDLQT